MVRRAFFLFEFVLLFLLMGVSTVFSADENGGERAVADAQVGSYIIGAGDVLIISVWKEEALTRMVTVLPDGMISFPLIGEIKAGGENIGRLKEELESRLTRYVPEVVLSLEVKQVNSMLIYVIGHVRSPGRFVLNADIDVLQALAMAGGLDPYAVENKIKIFRKEGNTTVIFPFRYDDVIEGENIETNFRLKRGDVIIVP